MDRPAASTTLAASAAGGGEPGDLAEHLSAAPGFLAEGSPRGVLETALTRVRAGEHAVLALVLETDGSTYAGAGDMVLFCNGSQVGWLSGGCLEPELARRAEQVSAAGRVDWIEIDTRSDDDLLSGSALGCRGRLRIALLPLRAMAGIDDVIEAWLRDGVSLQRALRTSGQVVFRAGLRARLSDASCSCSRASCWAVVARTKESNGMLSDSVIASESTTSHIVTTPITETFPSASAIDRLLHCTPTLSLRRFR